MTTPTFKMTICGIGELHEHRHAGVSHVLSILDPMTPEPDAFDRYAEHTRLALRFHDVIEERLPGYESPQPHHIGALLAFGRDVTAPDAHVLIHCHMGISRSTAASLLMLIQAEPDRSPEEAMAEVARIRPKAWPNLRMIEIGDEMLLLNGALIRAVRARHHALAGQMPQVADFMRNSGRARELE